MASWDILPKGMSRDAAYRLPLWGCLTIIPGPSKQGAAVARQLLANRHQIAERRGRVQYRPEEIGDGEITYCRVQAVDGTVEFSATLVAEGIITVIELHTRQEGQAHYEQLLVKIAHNIRAIELHMPGGEAPHKGDWDEAVSRYQILDPANDHTVPDDGGS